MLLSSAISVLLEGLLAVYNPITVLFVSLIFKHIVCGVCVCICAYLVVGRCDACTQPAILKLESLFPKSQK